MFLFFFCEKSFACSPCIHESFLPSPKNLLVDGLTMLKCP